MALGASGPPASAKQISYLQALLEKAGYATFREARRAYGLTQRQAGGKFTKQEASALIDRLVNGEPEVDRETVLEEQANDTHALVLRGMPAQWLADELIRRGWQVTEP
jgi:hypothetical protein